MDYTPIIKRNFITLMEKYYELSHMNPEMEHIANSYKRILLQLPLYPILSQYDLRNVNMENEMIKNQIIYLLNTNTDLDEVVEYNS